MLQGRAIKVEGDRLVSPEGTLAGSTLTMSAALANAMDQGRIDLTSAARMAATTPACFLGMSNETGAIAPGLRADLVAMRDDFTVTETWIGGVAQGD
jgi:N-acetylglucosamine-6-phosphate deacetylase